MKLVVQERALCICVYVYVQKHWAARRWTNRKRCFYHSANNLSL